MIEENQTAQDVLHEIKQTLISEMFDDVLDKLAIELEEAKSELESNPEESEVEVTQFDEAKQMLDTLCYDEAIELIDSMI